MMNYKEPEDFRRDSADPSLTFETGDTSREGAEVRQGMPARLGAPMDSKIGGQEKPR